MSSVKWPGPDRKTQEKQNLYITPRLNNQPQIRADDIGTASRILEKNTRTLSKVNEIAVPVEIKCNSILLKSPSLKATIESLSHSIRLLRGEDRG